MFGIFLPFDSHSEILSASSTLLWRCLFLNFTQFVILENFSIVDLAPTGVKGLRRIFVTVCCMIHRSVDSYVVTRTIDETTSFS